jgi:dTDP-4-amino-4,6-dideoxygalactose transaminase
VLVKKITLAHNHRIIRDAKKMKEEHEGPWYYEQVSLGYNYRMTDFQAAMLISQLKKLSRFSNRRKEIAEKYDKAFADVPELFVQKEIAESDTTRHLYIIRLIPEKLNCDRRQFFDALRAENVCPQVHYLPVYWHSYYESLGYKKGICPNAEKFYEEVMSIPLYPSLTDDETDDVIRAVKKVVAYYRR